MPITSLIVTCATDSVPAVAEEIAQMPNVEVTDVRDDTLVIITDTKTGDEDQTTWDALVAIPGVISTDIIYHNFEDAELETHVE